MAISEIIVEWFPLIFGASFLATFLAVELRKIGHLKLGRELKKGEAITLLILLTFNLLIAAPIIIVGLLIEYTVGAPSALVVVLFVAMALADLIPILLSGAIAFAIIDGIYDNWGLPTAAIVVTGIVLLLTGLDSIGWLQPAQPFIIDMLGTLVSTQFMFLGVMIVFAICMGRCQPSSKKSNDEKIKPSRRMSHLSPVSGLKLIVGLGKRIVNDSDENALTAMKSIYFSNKYSKKILSISGNEINLDIESVLERNDIILAQQLLEVVNGQFGKFSKTIHYGILLFTATGIISAILLGLFVTGGIILGVIFLFPAILLPVIAGLASQQTSRFQQGRYGSPLVSQFNSFMLTEKEFKKRVLIDRVIYSLSVLSLFGIVVASVFGYIPSPLVAGMVCSSILILVVLLSSKDRSLSSKRLETSHIIERGLKFIGAVEDEEIPEDQVETIEMTSEDIDSVVEIRPKVSEDWKSQLEQRGHENFAKKVANHEREAYDETRAVLFYLIPGGMITLMGIMTYLLFTGFSFFSTMHILSIGFIVVGTPLLLFGIFKYLKIRESSGFYGVHRKQLTILLSHFDQTIQGVTDFGTMTELHAPSEYLNFGITNAFMPTIIRASIIKLSDRVTWPNEELEKIWKTRSSYPKLELIALIGSTLGFLLIYQIFMLLDTTYFPEILKLLFLGLVGVFVLTTIYSIIQYYREKRILTEIVGITDDNRNVTYRETMESLLTLILSEFTIPLRVLFVGYYPQATYTGHSYFTTTGIEAKEAVIIPNW